MSDTPGVPAPGTALLLNLDRTVVVPTARGRFLLAEPTMGQIKKLWQWMIDADVGCYLLVAEAHPDIEQAPVEQVNEWANLIRYDPDVSPYAQVWVRLIRMLCADAPEDLSADDLYGWCGNTSALAQTFNHWQSPLNGSASQLSQLLAMLEMSQPKIPASSVPA